MESSNDPTEPELSEDFVEYLRQKAGRRAFATYSEVAPLLGIDTGNEYFGVHVGQVLDTLNRREFAAGRPLLSAIVVTAATQQPGAGYYACARNLLRYRGDDFEAWVEEVAKVFAYWPRR